MAARTKLKSPAGVALKSRFGANVKRIRRRLGLSQEQLAARARMHRTYVADIERGSRNISLFSIVRLVNALGTSLSAFFRTFDDGHDNPPARRSRRVHANGRRPAIRAKKARLLLA